MTRDIQRTMALCGAAFVLLLFPAIIMTGLLPPMSPMRTAEQVAQFWSTNTGLKRVGLVIMLAAAGLQAPFGALIAVRIRQMEGSRYSALAYTQLVGTGLAVVAILMPTFAFAAASYRPERDPQITQALNDLGWLPFVMNWPAATIQCLVIGFAIFGATNQRLAAVVGLLQRVVRLHLRGRRAGGAVQGRRLRVERTPGVLAGGGVLRGVVPGDVLAAVDQHVK